MNQLAVTTYRRMSADLEALERQTKKAFVQALIQLTQIEGLSGLQAARRLGVSQPHVARTLAALRLAGVIRPAAFPPSEEVAPEALSGPSGGKTPTV
jgi:DNA-binding MarR family transcriptional regulator